MYSQGMSFNDSKSSYFLDQTAAQAKQCKFGHQTFRMEMAWHATVVDGAIEKDPGILDTSMDCGY
jgi:hypothetical protein